MKKYLKRTLKNKIVAVIMILATSPVLLLKSIDGIITLFVMAVLVGVPLFFTSEKLV